MIQTYACSFNLFLLKNAFGKAHKRYPRLVDSLKNAPAHPQLKNTFSPPGHKLISIDILTYPLDFKMSREFHFSCCSLFGCDNLLMDLNLLGGRGVIDTNLALHNLPSGNLTWLLNMAIEIVSFRGKMVDLSIVFLLIYQRVHVQNYSLKTTVKPTIPK
jgi:hypothetical protein